MTGFPHNVLDLLVDSFKENLTEQDAVIKRPLRLGDPQRCIGVFAADWNPVEGSQEIGAAYPTLSRYTVRIQNQVRAADAEQGQELVTFDAKMLLTVLYLDRDLHLSLGELSETAFETVERFKRMRVANQRYFNNQVLNKGWVYLTLTTLTIETDIGR